MLTSTMFNSISRLCEMELGDERNEGKGCETEMV